jgi:hypothetical protein
MKKLSLTVFIIAIFISIGFSNTIEINSFSELENEIITMQDTIKLGHYNILIDASKDNIRSNNKKKIIAIAADILTGPLGGHRIYLGTKPWVPIVYAVTLGGGLGTLPIIDLFVIIFTHNLNRYCNNPQIIMWL